MPEEKTKLGNQTAPEKKSDAAKLHLAALRRRISSPALSGCQVSFFLRALCSSFIEKWV